MFLPLKLVQHFVSGWAQSVMLCHASREPAIHSCSGDITYNSELALVEGTVMASWLVSTVTMDMRGTATTSASQPSGSAHPPCPRIATLVRTTGTALGKCILQPVWFGDCSRQESLGSSFFLCSPLCSFSVLSMRWCLQQHLHGKLPCSSERGSSTLT